MLDQRRLQGGDVVALTAAVPSQRKIDDHVGIYRSDAQPVRLGWLLFWTTGTLLAFIMGAVSVRALATSLSVFEMMTVRGAGSLLILFFLAVLQPELATGLKLSRMALQGTRAVVHFGSQTCWALAITLLPFATVFALEFTIPAWVALLAVLFLNERMTANRTFALAVSFAGVLVILRPGLAGFQPAALIMLAGALFFAITAIMTKKLITTETTFAILFWMNLIELPLNFACSDWLFFLKVDQSMALPLLGVTIGGLLTYYCLTNAFRCGDAIVVIPMDFLRLPLIALIGWAYYGEQIDAFVFVGAGLIIAGVLWNVRSESRRNGHGAQSRPLTQPASAKQ